MRNLEPGASLRFCTASHTVPELTTLERALEAAQGWGALIAAGADAGAAVLSAESRELVGQAINIWEDASSAGAWDGRKMLFVPFLVTSSLPHESRSHARSTHTGWTTSSSTPCG